MAIEVHKQNQAGDQEPLCRKIHPGTQETVLMRNDIDKITCVFCLRMLAKDAVLYGNGRRPARKW